MSDADGSLTPLTLDIAEGNEQGDFAIDGYVVIDTRRPSFIYKYTSSYI